jgi:hypothetical protein
VGSGNPNQAVFPRELWDAALSNGDRRGSALPCLKLRLAPLACPLKPMEALPCTSSRKVVFSEPFIVSLTIEQTGGA